MKAFVIAALTLSLPGVKPHSARAQATDSMSSVSEQADQDLAVALWKIAVASHTRIGFESIEVVHPKGAVFRHAPSELASSLDDALDSAISANPRYEWRRVGDDIVVRPAGAWSDVRDPFNRPVRHFSVRTNEASALIGIQNLIHAGAYEEKRADGTPVMFTVESGTLIDVMSRLAESAEITFWQAGYKPHPFEQRRAGWDLDLTLVNDVSLRAATFSRIPSNRVN